MALWTPAEITTALWLDADDSSTITLDGSNNVEQWDDKSGNNRDFTQGTMSYRPVVSAAALNGLDMLSFDGSDDHLISSYNLPDTVLVLFVAKQTGQTSGGSILRPVVCASETSASTPLFFAGPQRDSEILDIGIDETRIPTTAGSWTINESVVISAHYDGTTLSGWKNGTSYGTVNDASGSFGPLYAGGDRSGFTERRFGGLIGEIVILPATGDRQKIEGYLAWKWGLETNLPTGHPYEDAAPTITPASTALPPFNLGLAINTGNIIGAAHTTLSPLEMGLALDSTPSESVPAPAFSIGLSMDMASALLTRYVALEPFNLGLSSDFGNVTQNIALSPLEMGLALDGSPLQSIPVQPFQIGLAMDLEAASSFETGSAIIRYFCILTGAADGLADVTLPMASFQARRRSGDPTFLQVVVPTMDYATDIANRPDGTLTIRQAYEQNGIIKQTETIMQADLDTVRTDEGGQNKSVTLTGYSTATFTAQAVTLSGVTYRSTVSGQARYRLARPYIFLNPGDTVTISDDGVTFLVDTMSYFINATTATIELASV